MDSRVLLELCTQLQAVNCEHHFSAIHINHQLQIQSEAWAEFCITTCHQLNLDCIVKTVNVRQTKGKSLEQAARDARRNVFHEVMNAGDVLLTAHHLNDQAETVLLRLFRGSGITGLSGIRDCVNFASGWMARPLLSVTHDTILHYATQHSLQWVQDPTNQSLDYDRNYLRHIVIPQLEQRWQGVQNTLARNATHCQQADTIISDIARQTLQTIVNNEGHLVISKLIAEDDAMQNLVLREWFVHHSLNLPSSAIIRRIKQEVIGARIDAQPCLPWLSDGKQYQLRRYRNLLCLVPPKLPFDSSLVIPWDGQSVLELPANLGDIKAISSETGGIDLQTWNSSTITIRFRNGREKCQLPGRTGHRELKAIFQELGIPPWERSSIPLVYLDDQLAAIGERLICGPFHVSSTQPAIKLKCLSYV